MMPIDLLRPVLHSGGFGWDEYVIVGLGLLVLIFIAFSGKKPDAEKHDREGQPPDHEV